MTEWISVKDKLPDFGVAVIVHVDNGFMTIAHLKDEGVTTDKAWQLYGDSFERIVRNILDHEVTHWRPLPEPPNTKR